MLNKEKPSVYAELMLPLYLSTCYNNHNKLYTQIKDANMPAKTSGEIKIRIIHNAQKNGDTYVLERQTIYDSDKKWNRVLSTRLMSKIPKGSETPVPTRPKKPYSDKKSKSSGEPNSPGSVTSAS